jgi:hypothetical protein
MQGLVVLSAKQLSHGLGGLYLHPMALAIVKGDGIEFLKLGSGNGHAGCAILASA